ncbi:HD-GYP domain-containing protein [Oscillospiraceae bacterium OttesenSCG-928-F05]|nr:HD-GYP domain-containing protein [Oscillospiraceae bacterium OttesenSCG-928-F05]
MELQTVSAAQPDSIVMLFSNIIGARDEYTQGHSHHVAVVAEAIAKCVAPHLDVPKLVQAALLHDIGKIYVPETILNKDGPLDDEEWEIMRRHPEEGKRLLRGSPFECMCDAILYHHERVDGTGYYRIPGEKIPLESKIIAVADTFSALRTYRAYRPAKPIDETIAIMGEAAGTQLDAEIVGAFLSLGTDRLGSLQCNCDICARRRLELEQRAQAT